ncbi:MAG: Ig-like domain-containing protein [Pseudomonadota bacterium]
MDKSAAQGHYALPITSTFILAALPDAVYRFVPDESSGQHAYQVARSNDDLVVLVNSQPVLVLQGFYVLDTPASFAVAEAAAPPPAEPAIVLQVVPQVQQVQFTPLSISPAPENAGPVSDEQSPDVNPTTAVPGAPPLASTADSGPSLSFEAMDDAFINQSEATAFVIVGMSDAIRETVTVTFEDSASNTVVAQARVGRGGRWALTDLDLTALQQGPIKVTAVVADGEGNVSTITMDLTLEIEPPDALQIELLNSASSQSSAPLVADPSLLLHNVESGAQLYYTINGGKRLSGPYDDVNALNAALAADRRMKDGPVTVGLRQIDAAGNESQEVTITFELDTKAPRIVLDAPDDDGYVNGGEAASLTISGTTDQSRADVTLRLSDQNDGLVALVVRTDRNGDWSISGVDISHLHQGRIEVIAEVSDSAGNTGSASFSLTLDTAPPEISIDAIGQDGVLNADEADAVVLLGSTSVSYGTVVVRIWLDDEQIARYEISANRSGDWASPEVNFSHFVDGVYRVTAEVTDVAGNLRLDEYEITLDTSAALQQVKLANETGSATTYRVTSDPTLIIEVVEPGASLRYTLDGGDNFSSAYTSVADLNRALLTDSNLADGEVTVGIAQQDAAGNVSAPQYLVFTLDRAVEKVVLSLASDTGSSSSDDLTSDPSLRILHEPGADLFYTLNGEDSSGPFVNVHKLNKALLTDRHLHDGEVEIGVYQVDPAGNTSAIETISFQLDRQAPERVSVTLLDDTGDQGSDKVTSTPALLISDLEANARLRYSLNGGLSYSPLFADSDALNRALTQDPNLDDGQVTVGVVQVDAAGNTSTATNFSFTLDRSAARLSVALANDTGPKEPGQVLFTSDPTLLITGMEPGAQLAYSLDGMNFSRWFSVVGALNQALAQDLQSYEGEVNVSVRQIDMAGNVSADTSLLFMLDKNAPSIDFDNPDLIMNGLDNKIQVSGTSDIAGQLVTVTLRDDNSRLRSARTTTDDNGNWSVLMNTKTLADGEVIVLVEIDDLAGNKGVAQTTMLLDTESPARLDISLVNDTGKNPSDRITSDPTVTIDNLEPGALLHRVDSSGEVLDTFANVEELNHWILSNDASVFTLLQMDEAGNWSGKRRVAFTLDTRGPSAPTIDAPLEDDDVINAAEASSVVMSGEISNDTVSILVKLEDGSGQRIEGEANLAYRKRDQNQESTWSLRGVDLTSFQDGDVELTVTAFDLAGNETSVVKTMLLDTTAPEAPAVELASSEVVTGEVLNTPDPRLTITNFIPGEKLRFLLEGDEQYSELFDSVDEMNAALATALRYRQGAVELAVQIVDAAGNFSDVSPIAFNLAPEPAEVVIFDLVDGTSTANDDGQRRFEQGVQYTIYIKVSHVSESVAFDQSQMWRGGNNLGWNDQIILIADSGDPILGYYSYKRTGGAFDSAAQRHEFFTSHPTGSAAKAASLSNGGSFRRIYNSRSDVTDLWFGKPDDLVAVVYTPPPAPALTIDQPLLEDDVIDTREYLQVVISGTSDAVGSVVSVELFDGDTTIRTEATVGGDNRWQTPALNVAGQLSDGPIVVSAMVSGPFGGVATDERTIVKGPLVVVFDLVKGTSSEHSNRMFDEHQEYAIFIIVDEQSEQVSLNATQRWMGAERLNADDRIILLSSILDGAGNLASATRTHRGAGQVQSAVSAVGWLYGNETVAKLNRFGEFTRFYDETTDTTALFTPASSGLKSLTSWAWQSQFGGNSNFQFSSLASLLRMVS